MAVDLDVSGWTITNGISFKFPVGTVVHGGSYIVVAISQLIAILPPAHKCVGLFPKVIQFWRDLELRNNDGRLEDSVSYGTDGDGPWVRTGWRILGQSGPKYASGLAENWATSAQVGGTPGAANFPSINAPRTRASCLMRLPRHERHLWLELFNDGTNNLPLDGYVVAQQGSTNAAYVFRPARILAGSIFGLDQAN